MNKQTYKHQDVEREVQKTWADSGCFKAEENSDKPKFYCLSMFPYPSGRLHMGHVRNYTLGDVVGRFQRLQGRNVLQPMGWDAFGLPAENAAIKRSTHPAEWTRGNIEYMKKQLQALGFAFDWSREFATCEPGYYRWEQWFFNRMFRKGLAYKKAAWVNWDPVDQTVLANEQVINGRGWRSDAPVERRELAQWFVRITDYAEELLTFLDDLPGWPEKVKTMQRNWIGKSEGVEINFPLADGDGSLSVYTTRPDTLMGATYLAVAPQHPLALAAGEANPQLQAFLEECNRTKMAEAEMARLEKQGLPTGIHVIHPLSGEAIPVWVANFVLMEYGSGAVMSVPGHDQRDWEFARKFDLPIKQVIVPLQDSRETCDLEACAFTAHGVLVNSGDYDGLDFEQAFAAIADALVDKGLGRRQTNYRLRDWGVSRQRYWGCPVPIVNCSDCGAVPVPDENLPVVLPTDVAFDGVGSPFKQMPEWCTTTCPECGGPAARETDTFDTFMESSWYYARFASHDADDAMLDGRAGYWTPVDHYVGGEEHAILHLLYARFFHKVMRDEGLLDSDEPFEKLLSLGMVLQGGTKMSKSTGDAGDPQHLMEKFGADAIRMAMMFSAPPEQPFEWSDHGVESANKWIRTRLWNTVVEHLAGDDVPTVDKAALTDEQKELRRLTHETLVRCEDDYRRRLAFNKVIASVMSLMNEVVGFGDDSPQGRAVVREALTSAVLIMSPITPHACHALWRLLGLGAIEQAQWPQVDEAALEKKVVELIVQVNGKLRGKVEVALDASEDDVVELARRQENVERFVADKTVRKVVHVPNKILNFVVS